MRNILLNIVTVSLLATKICFALPLSSGSIESDLTVKNPEKFAQQKLIPQYLEKAEKTLILIKNDKELRPDYVKKHKGESMRKKINKTLEILQNNTDRINVLHRRLKYANGEQFNNDYKNTYFKNIKGRKNKESDPFNILKIDEQNIDKNRDCLYRFLSWNIPGQKSIAQIRAMSTKEIQKAIADLRSTAKAATGSTSSDYSLLVREIGSFFDNELEKEQYDAFIDGKDALNRLVIPNQSTRNSLKARLETVIVPLWIEAKQKVLEAQQLI